MLGFLLKGISTTTLIYLLMAVFGILILVGLGRSYSTIKEIISISRTHKYRISALPSKGLIEVVGKAEGRMIQSPITQTDCLLWEIYIRGLKQNIKESSWDTLYKESSKDPIVVRD